MSNLRPVQDRYGITRELKDDYEFGTVLPGAVTIPSHKDNKGSQLGREKRGPIPMVIDPDYYGEDGVVITPGKLDANLGLLTGNGDPSEIYKKISSASSTPVSAPVAKAAAGTPERSQIMPRRKRGAVAPPKTESAPAPASAPSAQPTPEPAPASPAGNEQLDAVVAAVGRLASMVQTQSDTLNGVVNMVNELTAAMDAMEDKECTAAELAPLPLQVSGPLKDPEPLPPAVSAPKTRVTFQFPDSQLSISSRYHSVLRDGNNLILVFDTDFEYGDRMDLAPNMNSPYLLTVSNSDGTGAGRFPAMYFGQRFTHGNYEYTLFVLPGGSDESGT